MIRGLGWIPDKPDGRDRVYAPRVGADAPLPTEARLWERIPRWRDQGPTSSCTGHAAVAAMELLRIVAGLADIPLSVAHAYWLSRVYGGYQHEDGGAMLRDTLRALIRLGVCSEAVCPLVPDLINVRPDVGDEIEGITRTVAQYERIVVTGDARIEAVMRALADDCPVICGKQLTDAYMEHRGNQALRAPRPGERDVGGHATIYCGLRTEVGGSVSLFEQNSWWRWGISTAAIPAGGWVDANWLHRCHDLIVLRQPTLAEAA